MTLPSPAPVSRSRQRPLARHRATGFAKLALLLALATWTAWSALQRPALHAAEHAFARGDARDALRLALDDMRVFRWSRASALIAARSLSREIYPDEAEPLYATAGRFAALPLEAQHDRIQGFVRGLQNERAIALCHEVLTRYPDDPTTLRYLALTEWKRGNLPEARDPAERLSRTASGQVDGLGLLASINHDADRFDAEAAALEAILQVDPELKRYRPGSEVFWREFGNALVVSHRSAEARDYLQAQITPYCDTILLDILGAAQRDLNDRDGAERSWRESARRSPKNLNPWLRLGILAMDRKQFAEAAESLEKTLAIAPGNIEANYLLARAYKFLGRDEDAKTLQAKADELRKVAPPKPGGMGPSK